MRLLKWLLNSIGSVVVLWEGIGIYSHIENESDAEDKIWNVGRSSEARDSLAL